MRPSLITVGGLARFSTVDWPGMITATVFCQGCAWRCRYCHNPHLIPFRHQSLDTAVVAIDEEPGGWTWTSVAAWLRDRRGLLDGVVFSGGEPTLQPRLAEAIAQARELGFRIGLHTGGPVPSALATVLPLVDWVGFDFKAPFADYARVTGRPADEAAAASLRLLRASGVAFEVRTTWHPALLSEADLETMAETLAEAGVREWVVQRFRPDGCADTALCASGPVGDAPLPELAREGLTVRVR